MSSLDKMQLIPGARRIEAGDIEEKKSGRFGVDDEAAGDDKLRQEARRCNHVPLVLRIAGSASCKSRALSVALLR